MSRASWFAIACMAAAAGACGDQAEHGPPADGAVIDQAPPLDEPGPDAPQADAPSCAKPVIFIDGDGGHYMQGASDDSRTNTSSVVTGALDVTGPGAARAEAIAARVRAVLPAVQVTSVDPGATARHVEVVLVSGTWTFGAGVFIISSFNCAANGDAVVFSRMNPGISDGDAAGQALFGIGAEAGCDNSTSSNNCMAVPIDGCTFSATAATSPQGACGVAMQDQLALLHAAFGCD